MTTEPVSNSPIAFADDRVALMGSVCTACQTTGFPQRSSCSRCGAATTPLALATTGNVWSWTVQRIPVKPPYAGPQPFEPFVVAYVDLGSVTVETPLFGRPVDGWHIGDAVQLATGEPRQYLQFWFEPQEATA